MFSLSFTCFYCFIGKKHSTSGFQNHISCFSLPLLCIPLSQNSHPLTHPLQLHSIMQWQSKRGEPHIFGVHDVAALAYRCYDLVGVIEERLPGRGHRPRLTKPSARVGGDVELHALGNADPAGVACGGERARGYSCAAVTACLEICEQDCVFSWRAGAYSRTHPKMQRREVKYRLTRKKHKNKHSDARGSHPSY